MSRSTSLRANDYRAIFRLVGECRELGTDPLAWRRHLLRGARRLIGAVAAVSMDAEGFFRQPGFRVVLTVYSGFDDEARRIHRRYVADHGFHKIDAPLDEYASVHRTLTTRSHEQLIQRGQWERSVLFNEYFRPSRFDDRLLSGYRFRQTNGAGPGSHYCFSLLGGLGRPPFMRRERLLAHLLHRELAPMIGRQLALASEPSAMKLSPQRSQVLNCLLEGDSEKQIAARLGLTRHTIHQYVKAIYRHFGVNSRGELMARWIRFNRDDET